MASDDKYLKVEVTSAKGLTGQVTQIAGRYNASRGQYIKEGPAGKLGKIWYSSGYWYVDTPYENKFAWAEAPPSRPPESGWKTRGEGMFSSPVDLPIATKLFSSRGGSLSDSISYEGMGFLDRMKWKWHAHKERTKERISVHTDNVKAMHERHWPTLKAKASDHVEFAKTKYNEHMPYVKQKTYENATAAHEYITHPDTVESMKNCAAGCWDCLSSSLGCCFKGMVVGCAHCLDLTIHLTDAKKHGGHTDDQMVVITERPSGPVHLADEPATMSHFGEQKEEVIGGR